MNKLSTVLLTLALSAACISALPHQMGSSRHIPNFNDSPADAGVWFLDNDTIKKAEYVYFGGDAYNQQNTNDDFCNQWTFAAGKIQSNDGSNQVFAGCKVTDAKYHVAAVWITEKQNRGHAFSQTGPVAYNFLGGLTFVSPQVDAYVSQGGTCSRVTKQWCRDNTVPPLPIDLESDA